MLTAEALKRKIQSADDLLSVVKTMKALAAVSIRQYQRAVESLSDYNRTVEMGLQIVLKQASAPSRWESGVLHAWGPLYSARIKGFAGNSTTSSSSMPLGRWVRPAYRKSAGSSLPWE